MDPRALRAIRAWLRLDQAIRAFNADLRRTFGISGLQLALLRILAERSPIELAELRRSLALHPATVGQAVDALVRAGLCERTRAPGDRRAWILSPTEAGRAVMSAAPLAGPVRLRSAAVEPARLDRLADALDDAIELFGLEPWAGSPSAAAPGVGRRTSSRRTR